MKFEDRVLKALKIVSLILALELTIILMIGMPFYLYSLFSLLGH